MNTSTRFHALTVAAVRPEAGEAVVSEEFPFFADVGFRRGGLVDIEVVAPAGEFDTVVAHFFDKRGEICEWQIGPLAGE